MTTYDDDDFDNPQEAAAYYRDILKVRLGYKHTLEKQEATYGLATPPHVHTELEKVRTETRELRQHIKRLEGEAPPSNPPLSSALPIYNHPLPATFPANDWDSAAPEEAQFAVLQMINNFERQSPGHVKDTQVAEALQMPLADVRDHMDILEEQGYTKTANSHDGRGAMLTAHGRMRLRDS